MRSPAWGGDACMMASRCPPISMRQRVPFWPRGVEPANHAFTAPSGDRSIVRVAADHSATLAPPALLKTASSELGMGKAVSKTASTELLELIRSTEVSLPWA